MTRRSSQYLYVIDGVRFFAATIVALFHITYSVWANPESGARSFASEGYSFSQISGWTRYGWVGVEIFFVISGLVIANSSFHVSPRQFLRSRLLRLYPTTWICATLTLVVVIANGDYEAGNIYQRYIHSMSLFPLHPWIDPAYWTLAIELVFYCAVFALILTKSISRITIVATLFVSLSFPYHVLRFTEYLLGVEVVPIMPLQLTRLSMIDYGCFFALGIFAWNRMNRTIVRFSWVPTMAAVTGCALEIINHAMKTNTYMAPSQGFLSPLYNAIVPLLVWGFSAVIVFRSEEINEIRTLKDVRIRRMLRVLGLMTFPVYLLHFTIGVSIVDVLEFRVGINKYMSLVLSLASIYGLAFVICVWVEPFVRKYTDVIISRTLRLRSPS